MKILEKYFPEFSEEQMKKFNFLKEQIILWNSSINVISRKDIDNFDINHLLHSLSIAKVIQFVSGTKVLDIGTGGGFPGLPLAIAFTEVEFHLIDSIGKKIKVVDAISKELNITNVTCQQIRAEDLRSKYDFIVSRAVTALPNFMNFTSGKFLKENKNSLSNGILYLKGGDYKEELETINKNYRIFPISSYFEEEYFEEKDIVYIEH
ncbi:MAG: 16S rRNA (guanine(527)-N(7))-methyltransferase RsmG [Bacteroidales bacterium]|jgi:16S rRNA (guanine527-N7)-methyltransferase|nr:16S rRNA (guanine(527)-N(7))-methyltransferase RsmG [Bacteroidales bacterium]